MGAAESNNLLLFMKSVTQHPHPFRTVIGGSDRYIWLKAEGTSET